MKKTNKVQEQLNSETITKLPLFWRGLGRGFLFLFIIFILPLLLGEGWGEIIAQDQNKTDSLNNELKKSKQDTNRVNLLIGLSEIYQSIDLDTALLYGTKALTLSENLSDKKGQSKAYHCIGVVHYYHGNYALTLENWQKALKIREELKDKKGMSASYNNIGIVHENQGNYDKAIEYYLKALKNFEETGDKKGMSGCYMNIGIVHKSQGNYDKAIKYSLKSLKIEEELGDKNEMSACYNNIGNIHSNQGSYAKAIKYYLKSLKIREELGNKRGMSSCYNNIGEIHREQGSYDKAIEYYLKALKINKETGNKRWMSNNYNNIGIVHSNQGSYDKAIEYYLKSLKIDEEIGNKKGVSSCYNNIGSVYHNQGSYNQAIEHYQKALKIREELGDKNGIAMIYGNIASLSVALSDSAALTENQKIKYLNKAVEYGNKAIELAKEIKAIPWENKAANTLMNAYKKLGRYKDAIKYAEIFITTKDSMFSEEKTKALAEMGAKYETEKKQLQIEKMEKQKELDNKTIEVQKAENRKQLIIIISAIIGFIIVLVFSIILLRMFSQKRKANILLAEQKAEIEEKNRDIMDSITYAKRIQSAILPPQKLVKEYLKNSFILYKPKDIVAGDFYWMEHKDGKILFAAADCTGHGVPGAMVSVVCNNGLNRSVREHGLTVPGKILDKTREIVIQEFEKSEEEVKDGMDIAICSLEGNRLQYAGAHNPLWIIRNGEILEIKADRQPIGKSRISEPFTTHTVQLEKGDTLYIFSDGYVDQFGGEKGKKFKSKAFKELLISIQDRPMEEQRILIDDTFENWRGELEQIDDVCVIGVKI